MSNPTAFASLVASTAKAQFDQYHLIDEHDEPLASQIKRYWLEIGLPFPGVDEFWSAVFISWCVKTAGATEAEFRFSA
ncbi:MAG TPA: hypothetical protein VGB07_17900 [Blastocatellia bacterium]|jgi:hypothetical protein